MTIINLDANALSPDVSYKLLTGAVTPRPIAWISTLNRLGQVNLAPFSCYTYVAYEPPLVAVAIGGNKDTLANATRVGEFTINAVTERDLQPMVDSSRRYPADMSEAAELHIALDPGCSVSVPRVASAPLSLECKVERVIPMEDAHGHNLLIGRVLCFRVSASILAGDRIDMTRYRALGRLGGTLYVRPGEIECVEPNPSARIPKLL